jgi:hypothetical protein
LDLARLKAGGTLFVEVQRFLIVTILFEIFNTMSLSHAMVTTVIHKAHVHNCSPKASIDEYCGPIPQLVHTG